MGGLLKQRLNQQTPDTGKSDAGQENAALAQDFTPDPIDFISQEDIKVMDELDAMMSEDEFEAQQKKIRIAKRVFQILLSVACIYTAFLIYGALITQFAYGDSGKIEAVSVSVDDIYQRNEFEKILVFYLQARSIYEDVLLLDYRIQAGQEDLLNIAPEYEAELDAVSSLIVHIEGASIETKYNQITNMLYTWVQTHMAAYCQFMSTAITQNDDNAANEALACREVLYSNFQLISQNILTLCADIKGIDAEDISSWSPEDYVQSAVVGVSGNEKD